MIDAVEYKNGPKNQWRRTLWNAIADATPDRRNELVLYLPGSKDLDRPEAVRRGFLPANMIAVERSPAVASELRQRGVTVIQSDLLSVLRAWPASQPLGVVLADLQCGLTTDAQMLAQGMRRHRAMPATTVAVNLMRGRDGQFAAHAARRCSSLWPDAEAPMLSRVRPFCILAEPLIGLHEQVNSVTANWEWLGKDPELMSDAELAKAEQDGLAVDRQMAELNKWADPVVLPPYRSASAYWDSGVFRVLNPLAAESPPPPPSYTRNQIAAALAIRTRRLRGELQSRAV